MAINSIDIISCDKTPMKAKSKDANVYKANSDEFTCSKNNKKTKKSVLTLPNYPAPLPEPVSDVNESEYFNRDDNRKKTKRTLAVHTRKCRARGKDYEFFDKDARYCSQKDINFNCSSTDMKKKYKGDGKGKSKAVVESDSTAKDSVNLHDVWAVLRNINRFQFTPSPPISEDGLIAPKTTKCPRRRNNRKDIRVFETRCTEEYACIISSYEVDKSPSSSDKDTVIEKPHDFTKHCPEFEEQATKKKESGKIIGPRTSGKKSPKNKSPPAKLNHFKALTYQKNKNNLGEDTSHVICPNYKLKELIASNTIADRRETKTFDNDGHASIHTHDTRQPSQSSVFVHSENSGSSKAAAAAAVHIKTTKTKNKNKPVSRQHEQNLSENEVCLNDSDQQINGITKVVLSNAQSVQLNKSKPIKRNRLQTPATLMNPVIIPKLTKTEIQRRLIKQKFPIVILGKDQVSSSVVINQVHPQFDGLDKQMWPFMLNWCGNNNTANVLKMQTKSYDFNIHKKKGKNEEVEKKKLSKNNNGLRQSKSKDRTFKIDPKRAPLPLSEIILQSQEPEKNKPIQQFRDRILKLLYKKSSIINAINRSPSSDTDKCENYIMNTDTCNDNKNGLCAKDATKTVIDFKRTKTFSPVKKHPWAKAKWASDFIDNVIKKIKTGAYYTHDNKLFNRKLAKEYKEVEIQTVSTSDEPADESLLSINIPGFDDILPDVEIKTMNMNEISVKHCVTNIVVHFDVTLPTEPTVNEKISSSLIPIEVTKSHPRIFRCQNSILNAVLPAELCSILPKMLSSIVNSKVKLEFLSVPIDKTVSQLSIISEVIQYDSHIDPTYTIRSLLPLKHTMLPELWCLLNGRYSNRDIMLPKRLILAKTPLVRFQGQKVDELLPQIAKVYIIDYHLIIDYEVLSMVKAQDNMQSSTMQVTPCEKISTCTSLQTYPLSDRKIVSSSRFRPFNLMSLFESMAGFFTNIGESCFKIINSIENKSITISTSRHTINVLNVVALSFGNIKTDSFFNSSSNSLPFNNKIRFFANITDETYKAPFKCIENINCRSSNENIRLQSNIPVNGNKSRKKGFMKLYRKCKSTSNISREKATLLSKITNLDDFFRALGSGNFLSSVFDSQSEYKIMSSIQKMKTWTKEINPRQALLVLLLSNKKETSNLLRFRPVLLQGIAVNRISKANELDMEIEVIEREDLNRLSQYDGITYLPASIENQDTLFEELCWIAKTTASDHQIPFDESSEKHLRSLLEKRKQLNPSYLRVLARYVGLGILKSPGKK